MELESPSLRSLLPLTNPCAGPYSCIGRPLALMNLRTTVARLIMNFDVKFPRAGHDYGRSFEAGTREHFTLCPAELKMCFEKRREGDLRGRRP